MTFKSIIVHLDDNHAGEQRVDAAVRLARRFGSRLRAIYSTSKTRSDVDIAQLSPSEAARLIFEREARDRAEALLRRAAAAAALGNVEVRVLGVNPLDEALAEMRCADLSILAQPDGGSEVAEFDRRLLAQALLGTGGPVLVLPCAPSTVEIGQNVVIAWDGGREAARAVRDALPILASASHTTLISIGERCRPGEDAEHSQVRVASFLALHDVAADCVRMPSTIDPAEHLLSRLCDLGADLLVMGAYGHARVRELILGGVTRTMLEKMTVPLFLSH